MEIDRCNIHGDAAVGQERGVALNSASTRIVNSSFSEVKLAGRSPAFPFTDNLFRHSTFGIKGDSRAMRVFVAPHRRAGYGRLPFRPGETILRARCDAAGGSF